MKIKTLIIPLVILLIAHTLNARTTIYKDIDVGMSISSFNALRLDSPLPENEKESYITSDGLKHLYEYSKHYIELRNKLWQGLMIRIHKNKVTECTLQSNKNISINKLRQVFVDLYQINGDAFYLTEYQSFATKGYGIHWSNDQQVTSMNIILDKNNQFTLSIKKSQADKEQPKRIEPQKAMTTLAKLLGEDFSQNFGFKKMASNYKNKEDTNVSNP